MLPLRFPHRRLAAPLLGVALLAAACGSGGSEDAGATTPTVGDNGRPTAESTRTVNLTFEEAGKLAVGELFRFYGTDAGPAPFEVRGEPDELDGRAVWRVEGIYEVGEDERRLEAWTFWIGTPDDGGDPVVLERDGPRPVDANGPGS